MSYTKIIPTQVPLPVLQQFVARSLWDVRWRRHGIGVLQGYLHESDTGPEARIHIWSPSLMLPGIVGNGDAHNHRFDLQSTVLHGELLHTEFRLVGAGNSAAPWVAWDFVNARQHTDENRAEMRPLNLELTFEQYPMLLKEGMTYTYPRGCYHTSMPKTDLVVTLCVKSNQQKERARVIAPKGQTPVPAFSGPEISPDEINKLLYATNLALLAAAEHGA